MNERFQLLHVSAYVDEPFGAVRIHVDGIC